MTILGAKGHAKEIIDVLEKNKAAEDLFLFDDVSYDLPEMIFDKYPVLKDFDALQKRFRSKPVFILGTGNSRVRKLLAQKGNKAGGCLTSVISSYSIIGEHEVFLGQGVNIMHQVLISNSVSVGEGCLINAGVNLHHDVEIGAYSEIGPSAIITGGVKISENVFVGAGAVVLPNIKIGKNSRIGAGAVVTKDVGDDMLVKGIPAR